MSEKNHYGLILKVCIFATGLAGVVAEFVLSTLATYLLGDAVFQWTVVMSLMLFAMGLGSRISKYFRGNLLDCFILTEFCLSIFCATSSCLAYGLYSRITSVAPIIYGQSLVIGGLIGLEIPLVTRLNQNYEELRTNIASVLEKDYFGSLLGGLLFAFFALPHLGLTYTPIALGAVNYLVACILLVGLASLVKRRGLIWVACAVCGLFLAVIAFWADPIVRFGEQAQYKDQVVYAVQTPYQKIVITRWRGDHWLFLNGQEQFSTVDEHLYHEPLVHPVMNLASSHRRVLIVGGGDGLALREVLKYGEVQSVTMVDLDPQMTGLAAKNPILVKVNQGSMADPRLEVINQDAGALIKEDDRLYDVIMVDLPDPDTLDISHLYTVGFYRRLKAHLSPGGAMVTQAGSCYFAKKAFLCVIKTMRAAGLAVLPYHNHLPTMGEWGWVLAVPQGAESEEALKKRAAALAFKGLPSKFINHEAMIAMVNFGKGTLDAVPMENIEVNTTFRPVLPDYFREGRWDIY